MKKLILGISLMIATSAFAGDISSGGVLFPLSESIKKMSAIMNEVAQTASHYSQIQKIYPTSPNYYIVELVEGKRCWGQGYQLTESLHGFTVQLNTAAVYMCQDQ